MKTATLTLLCWTVISEACRQQLRIPAFHFPINIPSQYYSTTQETSTTTTTTAVTTTAKLITNKDFKCGSLELPAGYSGSTTQRPLFEGRIVGGRDAEENTWPWIVRVIDKNSGGGICG